jgi:tetratricopeptide (TPR) repeat protein
MKVASNIEMNVYKELLKEDKIGDAIKELEKLRKKYPNDGLVLRELGSVYLRGRIDPSKGLYLFSLAINNRNKDWVYNEIANYYLETGNFTEAEKNFNKISDSERSVCYKKYGLMKVYMHTNRFDEALECCNFIKPYRNSGAFVIEHYNNAKIYILYKLGKLEDSNLSVNNYFSKQLLNYDREAALDHIAEHLSEKPSVETVDRLLNLMFPKASFEVVHSSFNGEIDLDELYDRCLVDISNKNPDAYGIVDYYKCVLDNQIGRSYNGVETNYVEVITLPNSKDILTIYPADNDHINKNIVIRKYDRKQHHKELKKKKK